MRLELGAGVVALLGACAPVAFAQESLQLDAGAEEYMVAAARSAAPAVLELRGHPDGRLLRRQAVISGEAEFRFVAPATGSYRLHVPGGQVQLLERFAREAQRPEAAPPQAPLPSARVQGWLNEHGAGTPAFWAAVARNGTPVVEPVAGSSSLWVTFLWRGEQTRSVRLFWPVRQGDQERFARLPGSDVWHYSVRLPAETRLAYQLAPDVPQLPGANRMLQRRAILATVQVDPLNPRRWPAALPPGTPPAPSGFDDRHGDSSLLELPAAPPEPWLAERAGVPRGQLQTLRFVSARLGNQRDITVYTPPGYTAVGAALPLLLLFDQDAYLSRVPTPTILDNLIAAGRIPPLVAVLVANPTRDSRSLELPCNPLFADAVVHELLPWVQQRWRITADPALTVSAGSSFGGLASAWLALRHPQRIGRVLSLSGSYWWAPTRPPGNIAGGLDDSTEGEWLTRQYAEAPPSAVQFFVAAGLLERSAPADGPGILETNRHLRDVLRARGNRVHYREFAGGHDYVSWRSELAEGLIALLGK